MVAPAPTAQVDAHTMQCMEVWGGFGVSNSGVQMPGIDAWVFSRPYADSHEGGDVHYVSSCGTGRISRVLLADISGHGAQVADLAKTLRSLMRRYVNFVDQQKFVERLNAEFSSLTQMGLFATAAIATYFGPSGTLSVSNAGHPRPLLYNTARKSWRILTEEASKPPTGLYNLPLGLVDDTAYPSIDLKAMPGDVAIFYSDSLIEAPIGAGRLLGQEGLLDLARTLDTSSPATLTSQLFETVQKRSGVDDLGDDVTILVLRPNETDAESPLGERLRAQLRFYAMVGRSFLPGGEAAPWPEMSKENILGEIIPAFARSYGAHAIEF
ncbi:MAG: PP2C family protein-serine/threonine phosphatase [Phycisphaerales bacterium]